MFYVYEWFIVETNFVFYVGKGCRNRYKVRKHNKLFNYIINTENCESRIVKYFETEKEAFEYELIRSTELKKIGQATCNINKCGAGGSVNWWTEEMREHYSQHNVMKSQKQRERMSKNNPMKNKAIALRVNAKNSKKVIINGVEYKSVNLACEKYGCAYDTLKNWCKKGINPFGELCRMADEKQVTPKKGRYNKGGSKAIMYNGEYYEAAKDVADKYGFSLSCVCNWAKKGFSTKGIPCQYVDDKTIYQFKPKNCGEKNKKPIKVNGVLYPSKKEAEKALGMKPSGLTTYIMGIRRNNKYVCEYVNQQPSCTNIDKSSTKGSTTNG